MCIADLLVNIADKLSSKLRAINASLVNKGQTGAESFDDVPAKIDAITAEVQLQEKTVDPSTSTKSVTPDGGFDGLSEVTVNAIKTTELSKPSISVSNSGLITATVTQNSEGYVNAGSTQTEKQLNTAGNSTFSPTKDDLYILSRGTYLTGDVVVAGDSNFKEENIKSGVTMWGKTGTYEGTGGGCYIGEGYNARQYDSGSVSFSIPTENLIGFYLAPSDGLTLSMSRPGLVLSIFFLDYNVDWNNILDTKFSVLQGYNDASQGAYSFGSDYSNIFSATVSSNSFALSWDTSSVGDIDPGASYSIWPIYKS